MSHPFGIWSLVPPLLAIGLAIATRRVVASLFVGVAAGALIVSSGDLVAATVATFESYLWPALTDADHLRVFAFTLLMGAMVGVIHANGGMRGLVSAIRPLSTTRRRGQLTGWLLGLLVFFDDYANSLLLGTTYRPVTDRLRISREKLAYIVDSTAAPIAGVALVSTWVASEVGFIQAGLDEINVAADGSAGFQLFVETIVYRFYPILALLFVGIVAATGRDFGPMLAAERKALDASTKEPAQKTRTPNGESQPIEAEPTAHWYLAAIPIVVVIVVLVGLLYTTGSRDESAETLWQIIGQGDSYMALVYGSLCGLAAAIFLSVAAGRLSLQRSGQAADRGARMMVPALAVLWLAWSLAAVASAPVDNAVGAESLGGVGTAAFLSNLIGDTIAPELLPTIVFLMASLVAFSTGTSWGTMTILMPLVIETTWRTIGGDSAEDIHSPIMLASIGSVLAGAIFGDHCSPISDTTVLSSRASGCDHIAHVWTQMPYALLVGGVSILCGTLPVGYGLPVWPCLVVSVVALTVVLLLVGRRTDTARSPRDGSLP